MANLQNYTNVIFRCPFCHVKIKPSQTKCKCGAEFELRK